MLILFLPLLVFSQTEDNNVLNEEFFVMFYNVENLFDTIDSPITNDSEFLPKSKKKWNTYRYNYKLRQLERVFASISKNENKGNMPDIIGLCEVENRLVVEDILNTSIFNNQDYSIIHQDSPSNIYNVKFLKLCNYLEIS